MDIQQSLRDNFGFEAFLPGQEEVISRLLENHSCLAVFPTGQGKSLCYQFTALHLSGLTLVISPLVALMKDQVDFLRRKNIAAARLDSSISREEFDTIQKDMADGRLKLLFVAPERFANEGFLASLRRQSISLTVIDEAHCISEWGHNFRPDYLKLAALTNELGVPVSLCLTATATPKVAKDIQKAFGIFDNDFIQTGFYRPNLTLRFSPSIAPLTVLKERLAERAAGSAIVYVTLQKTAEKIALSLSEAGFSAKPYHAGLKDEQRHAVQEWFMDSDRAIVVATIAFGMGIDKADIRYVYHYNLPKSLENYTQEIGRAGRDGQPAMCELLGNNSDLTILENFTYGDTPDPDAITGLTEKIINEESRFSLSVYEISHEYDLRPLVVNTLLTYLELEDAIESTGPFYTSYKFYPTRPSAEMFEQFDEERQEFLRTMFSCAKKAKKWFTLDVDEVIEKMACPRERVVAALNYLKDQGEIELQVAGARRGFKMLNRFSGQGLVELVQRLQERFLTREQNDIKRLHEVITFIGHQGCQTRYLLGYFGEELSDNCGHCEYCISGNATGESITKHSRKSGIAEENVETIKAILAEQHPALSSTRQQARFFCGISSPMAGQHKLYGHPSFGLLADIPFLEAFQWLEKNH